ncbi:MBL fold metallo-hydrolase [Amycolatopsis sp. cmx-8-4]|uniref:MBL fold metallo-hydrolase n=1 Tax=Amycolatopsis sp. cmx-8-4 TaxID=2790947 RepID=UPI00397DC005
MTSSGNGSRITTLTEAPRPALVRRRVCSALTFLGGAGTSTGARYLVETPGARVLVGCGAFAGPADLARRNWSPIPDALRSLDAVVLTGADPAHSGFLPQLVAEGFTGPVFATPGTAALLPITLSEAAEQFAEVEAGDWPEYFATPPFRPADVDRAVALLRPVVPGAETGFRDVGLVLGRAGGQPGASWARLRAGDRSVLVTAPLGGANHPLLPGPEPRLDASTLVLPVAGHATGHETGRLAAAVHRAVHRGGSVLIPAPATGRAAVVLALLRDLMDANEIPVLPVHVDSPAGLSAIDGYRWDGEPRLPEDLVEHRRPGDTAWWDAGPSIVLAGPETAGPGRVLDHLARLLPDARNAVVVAGPVVPGTRAAHLAKQPRQVKIRGRYVPVRAEITPLADFREYADDAALRAWATAAAPPETAFVVEGETEPARALAKALHAEAGWCAVVPADGERVLL